jgi:antitoxin (DNA-binding transcriptional repressor) of toxin-antitoxin stability system
MKFITVRDLRTSPAQIWKQLPDEQEMVITNNGKPIALLTPLTDTNLENTIKSIRKARAIDALKNIQANAQKKKIDISDDEIIQEIKTYRKNKK